MVEREMIEFEGFESESGGHESEGLPPEMTIDKLMDYRDALMRANLQTGLSNLEFFPDEKIDDLSDAIDAAFDHSKAAFIEDLSGHAYDVSSLQDGSLSFPLKDGQKSATEALSEDASENEVSDAENLQTDTGDQTSETLPPEMTIDNFIAVRDSLIHFRVLAEIFNRDIIQDRQARALDEAVETAMDRSKNEFVEDLSDGYPYDVSSLLDGSLAFPLKTTQTPTEE